MAASHTLPHSFATPQISKFGVLTLYGYGIRVAMQAGHLHIEDGIGPERRKLRLPRVRHRLKRLVCIGEDGFVTLSALRWLTEVGASFVMLDRIGKVRVVTGPASPSETRLRRTQALALSNGTALKIGRELISMKLKGQETVVREKLQNSAVANSISELRTRLAEIESLDAVRGIEARAAAQYWSAWRAVRILFPQNEVSRIPEHWLIFGPRHSPLTGGPRLSVNPANSILNYTNAVAESECRLAACACGLDPGIGFLHTDTANRDSLALDLIETIRPAIEAWLLDWLTRQHLRRSDFFETPNGNCRISSELCAKLSETAPTWGKLVAPWAEYVVRELWTTTRKSRGNSTLPPTRLTHQKKRELKGRTFSIPSAPTPMKTDVCRGCGGHVSDGHNFCKECAIPRSSEAMVERAKIGRVFAHSEKAQRLRAQAKRRHDLARQAWLESDQNFISEEVFKKDIQPKLSNLTNAGIARVLGVSAVYATAIKRGQRRPHPRHWPLLAKLVGTPVPNSQTS